MLNGLLSYFENSNIDRFTDWFGSFITHNGVIAPVLLLALEEAGVPLPIPGDVYVAYMGYLVSKGTLSFFPAFILLLTSVLIGSSILYYLSSLYGQRIVLKFGKYIHVNEKKLLRVEKYFKKYGILVIIFGRHIPGFRVPITFFSGMSGITYRTFILSTFISVIFWLLFYLSAGEQLGPKMLKLLHKSQNFYIYLLFFILFVIFIASAIYFRLYKNKKRSF